MHHCRLMDLRKKRGHFSCTDRCKRSEPDPLCALWGMESLTSFLSLQHRLMNKCPQTPNAGSQALEYPNRIILWARDGVKLLGFAFGTDNPASNQMEMIQHSILNEPPILAQIGGFLILRLCVSASRPRFLRGTPYHRTIPHVMAVNKAICSV